MKWKNVLFTVVLNIFLMLLVTIIIEYNSLHQRMQEACDNINFAFDTAIESSTATEELFSLKNKVNNSDVSQSSFSDNGVASTLVWDRSGSWFTGNNYVLSWYYWNKGMFPTKSQYEAIGEWTPYKIWSWLYGGTNKSTLEEEWSTDVHTGLGQSYTNYPSTCRNTETQRIYSNSLIGLTLSATNDARKPSKEFKEYFDKIGYKVQSKYTFKIPDSASGRFKVEEHKVPVLLKMGLYQSGYSNYTDSFGSSRINDDMISTVKLGKRRNGESYSQSIYFYSPYSLGVTYVPVSVLKPMFLYNLDSIVRLGVASSAGFSNDAGGTVVVDENIFNQVDGCLTTNVYKDGTDRQPHIGIPSTSRGKNIINDGQVEYDLSSAKVRVDYFYVNMYSSNLYKLASSLYGALPARAYGGVGQRNYLSASGSNVAATGETVMTNIGSLIKANETGGSLRNFQGGEADNKGNMIVAKCTVRIKLHITYESYLLQWMCFKDHASGVNNHYDIKLYNPSTGHIETNSDGVWYEYSKYYAYTR